MIMKISLLEINSRTIPEGFRGDLARKLRIIATNCPIKLIFNPFCYVFLR